MLKAAIDMEHEKMITKSLLTRGILGLFFMGAALGAVARAEDPKEKLAELKKKREKVATLYIKATSVSRSGSGTRESNIETWEKNSDGKQKFRREVTAKVEPGTPKEQAAAPSLMIRDGETAWREMDVPGKKMVFRAKAQKLNEYNEIESLLEKKGIAKIRDSEKILDQPCVLLEIREKANPEDLVGSYWISEKYGIVLKSVVESAGATITEMKVGEFKVDEDISESKFAYKPPPDAQVFDENLDKSKKSP